ncbi:probable tRNA (uracil-O(2)-)-methyltransferase isoform X2 [Armigeres subalbatus]|uniref:probable tRNA (uracil-O(2)-)-methyltransferase isoform X2 n=1 Tax=Armigeres subalbatus TaxID=124917 RepID=UPI002ED47E82
MFNEVLISALVQGINLEHFFRAVCIYLYKPHVLNRKLFGISNLHTFSYRRRPPTTECSTGGEDFDVANLLVKIKEHIADDLDKIEQSLENGSRWSEFQDVRKVINLDLNKLDFSGQGRDTGFLVINRFLPRNLTVFHPLDVLAIIDFHSQSVSMVCLQDAANNLIPKVAFSMQLKQEILSINYENCANLDDKTSSWLKDVLFQRLLKWIDNNILQATSELSTIDRSELVSLSLINDLQEYNQLYSELKSKYGIEMVRIWPETTDPRKYVYEDVAIATYLILLWKQERAESGTDRLQSFVDIGCGNGLLVYILASEGHEGLGIDLRRRKIWDHYPANVRLKEQSIVPSDDALFPNIDWIIGNHSDELSPWIPVIAARSAYHCRYFLLPCCAFEFDGNKFQRQNSGVSQYGDFLRYVGEISEVCGFETSVDRLKIPSTKRTCLVGSTRNYSEDRFQEYSNQIQAFIDSRTAANRKESDSIWSESFRPRESVEKVRNCTKLERSVIDEIVRIVFDALIAKKRMASEFPEKNWNAGGKISIGELVALIPQDRLNNLKAECGGLQTLLKNNHQIFQVLNGCVQLRIPTRVGENSKSAEEMKKKTKKQKNVRIVNLKEKPCWFHNNHPDGCPFEENESICFDDDV